MFYYTNIVFECNRTWTCYEVLLNF